MAAHLATRLTWKAFAIALCVGSIFAPQNRSALAANESSQSPSAESATPACSIRKIEGWTVHIRTSLLEQEPLTEIALGLLQKQLAEISHIVPAEPLARLREVALWFSPEYSGVTPKAEYHPGVDWLRDHRRDPAMEKGVEFTNVRIFSREMNRMPNFALHELAHAYHDRVLPGGFENAEINSVYQKSRASHRYDRVERSFGNDRPNTFERAYAITSPQEYFAECTEAFFSRNDFFPFTRDQLKTHDPEMYHLLQRLWHVTIPR